MSNHTPGPWKSVWNSEEGLDVFAHIEDARGEWVAQLWSRVEEDLRQSPEETKANARLIAAAPKLLQIAEMVERIIHLGNVAEDSDDAMEEWFESQEGLEELVSETLKEVRGEE